MGINKAILTEGYSPTEYEKTSVRLELEECVHFHQDNLRLIWTTEQLKEIVSLFSQANHKLTEVGYPNQSNHMLLLSGKQLNASALQHNRWAIELTADNWIHVHLGNLRIHLTPKGFEALFGMFQQASVGFYNQVKTTVRLSDCVYPQHVEITYLPLLQDYISRGEYINPTEVGKLKYQIKRLIHTQPTLQREMDKPFAFTYNPVPEDLDTRYLFAVYESIKEWGYAEGPFYGELMNGLILPDGKIRIGSAHRVAALLTLGYEEVDVFLNEAE